MLCRVFSKLLSKFSDLSLEIIGEGEQRASLEIYIKNNNLSSKIKLLGILDKKQIKNKLQQADIYVHSSNHEGWGLAIAEAIATGLPIVSTKVGCAGTGLIINNKTGKVVPVGDELIMTKSLEQLLKNPKQAYKLSGNGQKLLKQKYQTQKIKNKWIEFLKNK